MKNQKGFNIIALLLSILVISFISFASYYVYNTQQNKKDETTKLTAASPTATPPATQSSQKYLVIKEWGVRVPVSGEYTDVTYKVVNDSTVALQSEAFAKLTAQECAVKNTSDYLGRIIRYDAAGKSLDPNLTDGPGSEASTAAIKFGNNYYDYLKPTQLYCSDTAADLAALKAYSNAASTYLANQVKQIQ